MTSGGSGTLSRLTRPSLCPATPLPPRPCRWSPLLPGPLSASAPCAVGGGHSAGLPYAHLFTCGTMSLRWLVPPQHLPLTGLAPAPPPVPPGGASVAAQAGADGAGLPPLLPPGSFPREELLPGTHPVGAAAQDVRAGLSNSPPCHSALNALALGTHGLGEVALGSCLARAPPPVGFVRTVAPCPPGGSMASCSLRPGKESRGSSSHGYSSRGEEPSPGSTQGLSRRLPGWLPGLRSPSDSGSEGSWQDPTSTSLLRPGD